MTTRYWITLKARNAKHVKVDRLEQFLKELRMEESCKGLTPELRKNLYGRIMEETNNEQAKRKGQDVQHIFCV